MHGLRGRESWGIGATGNRSGLQQGKGGLDWVKVYSIGNVRVPLMAKIYRQDEMNGERMKTEGVPKVEMINWQHEERGARVV